jgi:hypothetical protein
MSATWLQSGKSKMGAFLEAFIETILRALAELGLTKQPKLAKSKQIPFKHLLLMMICMAIFLGLINWLVSTLFHFLNSN